VSIQSGVVGVFLRQRDERRASTPSDQNRKQRGPQDLQRGPQWGIPEGSVLPAFASGGIHYLGFVSGLNGISLGYSELGGKDTNPFNKDPAVLRVFRSKTTKIWLEASPMQPRCTPRFG
jgi:hypothetical protein